MFFGCVVGVERREIGRHLVQNQKFIIVVEGINKNKTTWGVFKKITKLCSTPINIF